MEKGGDSLGSISQAPLEKQASKGVTSDCPGGSQVFHPGHRGPLPPKAKKKRMARQLRPSQHWDWGLEHHTSEYGGGARPPSEVLQGRNKASS